MGEVEFFVRVSQKEQERPRSLARSWKREPAPREEKMCAECECSALYTEKSLNTKKGNLGRDKSNTGNIDRIRCMRE
jgi:hypothetical protein